LKASGRWVNVERYKQNHSVHTVRIEHFLKTSSILHSKKPENSPEAVRLGTFAGVFTPSILTILGIILFRRMGYVVGSAGFFDALLILALANIISVLTTVSLSAIATNIKVQRGGDYYLISRTLGLEFGGAIGIVLFLAQSVSIAFYCIGFGEVISVILPGSTMAWPQIIAAAAVCFLFVFAWLGADWATRFQFGVMVILALALVSFFAGGILNWDMTTFGDNLHGVPDAPPFWVLFAIFFPAVTGFTQGVSMSGDLKDPGKSLPAGTFAAVGFSVLIYVGAAVIFAGAADPVALVTDYNAMSRVAIFESLIFAGVIAATLSSAMASFLGAPRILQSLAADRIFPFLNIFAEGSGTSQNPRRGVLLSGGIALATITMGNLNLIAPVVSMFFLISYGLLNYATYYEARSASPSFRPRFRYYDKRLSLAGSLACLGAMMALDITAGIVALLFLFGVYQYLSRTAGPSRWADSRRSHHLQEIRRHMLAAAQTMEHPRYWRPMILILSDSVTRRKPLLQFADWLQCDNGFATAVRLLQGYGAKMRKLREEAETELRQSIRECDVDVHSLIVVVPEIHSGIHTLVQSYGIGPVRANTILLNWMENAPSSENDLRLSAYGNYLTIAFRLGRNIVLLNAPDMAWAALSSLDSKNRRIDVWWQGDNTSRLMLLLAHMTTENKPWHSAQIRVLDASGDAVKSGKTVADLAQTLSELRISAIPEIVASPSADAIVAYSDDAALVFIPFRLRNQQPLDMFRDPLNPLFSRLPVCAAVLAAEDIDLAATPEAGVAAEIAAALDALSDARKKAHDAQADTQAAASAVESAKAELDRAIQADMDQQSISQHAAALQEAQKNADKAARRTAKAAVKIKDWERTARSLGADIPDEKSGPDSLELKNT
jgi:amino acid transporter